MSELPGTKTFAQGNVIHNCYHVQFRMTPIMRGEEGFFQIIAAPSFPLSSESEYVDELARVFYDSRFPLEPDYQTLAELVCHKR